MANKHPLLALTLIVFALIAVIRLIPAVEIAVTAEYVIDGDTFITTDKERIRLWGIDAPELKAVGGKASKAHLESLIVGSPLSCREKHTDRYHRKVMQCFNSIGDVAAQLVKASMAIDYPAYSKGYYQ